MELSLVMPMYNEEDCVISVIQDLEKVFEGLDYEFVVVNNGSTDNTGKVLMEYSKKNPQVRVVHVEKNLGYGLGVISGLKACKGDTLGWIDGDGQVSAEDVFKVYDHYKRKKVEFCRAIRYQRNDGLNRKVASFFFNNIFRVLFLKKVVDINAKPKFFSRRFYEGLNPESKDWFIDTEVIIYLIHKSFKDSEVFVYSGEREGGKSNVAPATAYEFFKNMLSWRFKLWKKSLK